MIKSVLVVCVGNICRSPTGERMLAKACPDLRIESAGIAALEGHEADKTMREVAGENGLSLDGHVARQFTADMAADFDLILALEKGHIRVITEMSPSASGKTMLFGQWMNAPEIADPHRKSREFYDIVYKQLTEASAGWVKKLGAK